MRKPFENIFNEADLLPKIRRSIYLMTMGNTFGNLWGVISASGSSSLTGYASYLGAGDFVFGLLTAIPLATALLQIPIASLVSRKQQRKKYMMTYGLFSRFLWLIIGLVPFFISADHAFLRLWTVIFLIGISSGFSSFINVSWMPWMADLVPQEIRGRWLSRRDGIISIASVTMGIVVARILDTLPGYAGYTTVFIMAGVLGMLDMCCFGLMEDIYKTPPLELKLIPVCKQILSDKPFLKFMFFMTAWSFTANMAGSYFARYAITEMGLSYMTYTLCSQVAAAAITVLIVSYWGRLHDHFGSKPVLWVSCIVGSLTPLFFLLSTYGSFWPTLLHNVIGAAFWSGTNVAVTSLQLSSSPDEQRPSYIAFFSCFTSVLGSFLGILTGGAILEGIHSSEILSAIFPDRYKFMFVLSVILRFATVLIFVPRLVNTRDYTTKDMFRELLVQIRLKKEYIRYRHLRRK
jgi:MFS family permease